MRVDADGKTCRDAGFHSADGDAAADWFRMSGNAEYAGRMGDADYVAGADGVFLGDVWAEGQNRKGVPVLD